MFTLIKRSVFLLLTISSSIHADPLAPSISDSQKLNSFKFYIGGWSPSLKEYQKEIVTAILEETREEYGEYELVLIDRTMSDKRLITELSKGRHVHFGFFSRFYTLGKQEGHYVNFPQPLMQGLLGLRKVMIRKADNEHFTQIASEAAFRQTIFGQVADWPDNIVYRHARLNLVGADAYDNLFPMLSAKRFDALPLSVIEIDRALKKQTDASQLTINQELYIYYPFPIFLSVTRQHPFLRARLNDGFEKLQSNGQFNDIFQKHFSTYITNIKASSAHVFILENPILTRQENAALAQSIQQQYFDSTSKFIYLYH